MPAKRNNTKPAEPQVQPEPVVEIVEAEPAIGEPPAPEPARSAKPPCARFRMNETVTPAERRAATRQYKAGGEYDADEFLTALWEANDPAVSPVE